MAPLPRDAAKRRTYHTGPAFPCRLSLWGTLVDHWPMIAVLAITVLVLWLFISEAVPAALASLLAATLLMVTGILEPAEGLSGFSNEATITVMAVFVVSAGVERTGMVGRALAVPLRWAGKGPRRQTLALGGVAGPVSGFINNTAVVAVLMPAAMQMSRDMGRAPSKILIPLSYLAMLGGTLTIIGTSTNLLGNAVLRRLGEEPFPFFGFFFVGAGALAVGIVYFLTIGQRLLPDRGKEDGASFDLKGFLAEYVVHDDGVAGRSLRDLGLTRQERVQVLRVIRQGYVYGAPRPTFRLLTGDRLLIQGSREALEQLPERTGLESAALEDAAQEPRPEDLATAEIVITPGSRLLGSTLEAAGFRRRHDVVVLAVRHHDRVAIGPLAKTRLAVGDVLLVQGSPEAVEALEQEASFVVTRGRGQPGHRTDKIPVALAIVVGMVLLAATGRLPIVVAALAAGVAMVLTGCLHLEESLQSVRWDIILLLAGIIPLGLAFEKVGLAAVVGQSLVSAGGALPPFVFLVLLFVVTSLMTEIMSNNASVVLLVPVAVVAAGALELSVQPFALTVMLAASTSMLTPIGYQTNTMVYAPGRYRFSDFARAGAPLNLILAFVIPFLVTVFYPL